MAVFGGPKIEREGMVTKFDVSNDKSFRGQPTTNFVPMDSASRYNNPGFSGTVVNTGQTFKGAPIWEVTFVAQNSTFIPRLGSTEGFGFFHSMGTSLLVNTPYMASIYFKTDFPLQNSGSRGFNNTYSNIPGWGNSGTSTTSYQEGEWTRLYSRYFNSSSTRTDAKFWKVTFNVANLQVGQVIRTYWAAPMIEQKSSLMPSEFVIGTRGATAQTGGGWVDLSGRNNNASFVNSPTLNRSGSGSLVFDGTNQSVTVPQPSISLNPNRFSVGLWIKPGNQSSRFLTPQSNGIDQYLTYDNTNQKIDISIAQSADTNERTRIGTPNTVRINQWTYFVFSIDNLSIKIYANGKLTNQYTETISIGNWSSNWVLGQRGNNTFFFLGEMSQFTVYDKVLTNQQVAKNFEAFRRRYGL